MCIWDGCVVEFVLAATAAVAAVRAAANYLTGRPIGENVLRDANVAFGAATLVAPVGAPAGRVSGALSAARTAEKTGEVGTVVVASETEANAAARIWAGVGSTTITASHGGTAATGAIVGRISADATRVARFAAQKASGTVAANLENVLTGSNMHVVVAP